jgi:hypothetical protein
MMFACFTPYTKFLSTTEEAAAASQLSKPSLNALILSALQGLQAVSPQTAQSTKEVHTYITNRFHYTYPVQTVAVVLSRLTKKTLVQRLPLKIPASKQRYAFYLVQSLESMRNQELLERFKPIADDFFGGDLLKANQYMATLLVS